MRRLFVILVLSIVLGGCGNGSSSARDGKLQIQGDKRPYQVVTDINVYALVDKSNKNSRDCQDTGNGHHTCIHQLYVPLAIRGLLRPIADRVGDHMKSVETRSAFQSPILIKGAIGHNHKILIQKPSEKCFSVIHVTSHVYQRSEDGYNWTKAVGGFQCPSLPRDESLFGFFPIDWDTRESFLDRYRIRRGDTDNSARFSNIVFELKRCEDAAEDEFSGRIKYLTNEGG